MLWKSIKNDTKNELSFMVEMIVKTLWPIVSVPFLDEKITKQRMQLQIAFKTFTRALHAFLINNAFFNSASALLNFFMNWAWNAN